MWTALDIFIGLSLCYAMVSLFCTAIQEFIAQMMNSRGKFLVEALKTVKLEGMIDLMQPDLVNNPGGILQSLTRGWGKPKQKTLANEVQKDGATASEEVRTLLKGTKSFSAVLHDADKEEDENGAKVKKPDSPRSESRWRVPFDIPADVFARTLLTNAELLKDGELASDLTTKINDTGLPDSLKTRLIGLVKSGQKSSDDAVKEVKEWYAGFMAQVEHWYARRSQAVSLVIGLVVALALNVDTVAISQSLENDPAKRAAIVELADATNKDGKIDGCPIPEAEIRKNAESFEAAKTDLNKCYDAVASAYPFPIGWDVESKEGEQKWYQELWHYLTSVLGQLMDPFKVMGILLSAIALSLGARFWFDMLKNLMALRTGGRVTKPTSAGTV